MDESLPKKLTKMAVAPGQRRRGIGEQLMAAAIAEFEARNGRALFLETNAKLEPALRLYARMASCAKPTPVPERNTRVQTFT